MEKEGQLYLLNKIVAAGSGGLILTACATTAPELPRDYNSVHATHRVTVEDFDPETARLTCAEIQQELEILNSERATRSHDIARKRGSNQVLGYLGNVFWLPLWVATDNDEQAKEKLANIQKAKDKLYKLQAFKKCPS